MRLSVGMATFDDVQGVRYTVQHLRLVHPCVDEIIVIDNNPDSDEGKATAGFCGQCGPSVRYIASPETVGTSAPRDRVFREATGDIVVCIDAHVFIAPGALARLLQYVDADAGRMSRDLWQGPMLADSLKVYATHMQPGWCDAMWGRWDVDPRGLAGDPEKRIPNPDAAPFDIPAQGLGLFACRREAWLGFNPDFRQFGGEEGFIHEKFRQAGRRTLCLPWLFWWHNFGRVGQPYPNTIWHRVRNYVIGWRELGLPLDSIHEHFVDGKSCEDCPDLHPHKRITEPAWQSILDGAAEPVPDPNTATVRTVVVNKTETTETVTKCTGCGSGEQATSLAGWVMHAAITPSDINEHVPRLQELSSQCAHVTEFGMRHGVSTVALLAGQPARFISYDLNRTAEAALLAKFAGKTEFSFVAGNSLAVDIEPTDMLFVDTRHTAEQLYGELVRHAPRVRRWIALHDTEIFGENGEGGGPGLLPALRRFLQECPRWSVMEHRPNNHGLTVLSCDPRDKPAIPGFVKLAGNFAAAVAGHVADGAKKVTPEQLQARLEICATCPIRNGDRCSHTNCGCFLGVKASWRSETCPFGKWGPVVDLPADAE